MSLAHAQENTSRLLDAVTPATTARILPYVVG
jgi:hypothetical protein